MASTSPFPHSPSPRTLAAQQKGRRAANTRGGVAVRPEGAPALKVNRGANGVIGNARLTVSVAVVLLVLLAIEGYTVLNVGSLLTLHVFLGLVLIAPIILKISSTTYRFARYYMGSPAYRHKGSPTPVLRLLGPLVVLLTVVLFASGVALLFTDSSLRSTLLTLHQVSFVFWFAVMTIHVLGHIRETASLAPDDFFRRTRGQVYGAGLRQWTLVISLVLGVALATLLVGHTSHFLAG
ncbi:MAG: hypothetical protein ACRDVC_08600 [Acidimicrobiales bacterium]